MEMEYDNTMVYEFLIKECKTKPELWDEFGTGLMEHTSDVDFWDVISKMVNLCILYCS